MTGDTFVIKRFRNRLVAPLPGLLQPLFVAMGHERHEDSGLTRFRTLGPALHTQLTRYWRNIRADRED